MLPLGLVLGFVSYGVTTWGWILVKGYNITLREWFSPLTPFTGDLSANGMVPQGSIFPTKGKGGTPAAGSGSGQAAMAQKAAGAAKAQNRPVPQGPGSRL